MPTYADLCAALFTTEPLSEATIANDQETTVTQVHAFYEYLADLGLTTRDGEVWERTTAATLAEFEEHVRQAGVELAHPLARRSVDATPSTSGLFPALPPDEERTLRSR